MVEPEDDYDGGVVLSNGSEAATATNAPTVSTSKRKREKLKQKKAAKRLKASHEKDPNNHIEETATVNPVIARLDPALASDYVAQRVKKFEKDLSSVELGDRFIPACAFADTTSWSRKRDLNHLAGFLQTFNKLSGDGFDLDKSHVAPGTPHSLVVSAAALRAADLIRALRRFQTKESMIAKLFAKHIKLKDSIEFLKKKRIGIGVGTAERILDLLKEDALKLDYLKLLVIDASYIDAKKRGIFDIKETQKSVMDLLNYEKLKPKLLEGQVKILLY